MLYQGKRQDEKKFWGLTVQRGPWKETKVDKKRKSGYLQNENILMNPYQQNGKKPLPRGYSPMDSVVTRPALDSYYANGQGGGAMNIDEKGRRGGVNNIVNNYNNFDGPSKPLNMDPKEQKYLASIGEAPDMRDVEAAYRMNALGGKLGKLKPKDALGDVLKPQEQIPDLNGRLEALRPDRKFTKQEMQTHYDNIYGEEIETYLDKGPTGGETSTPGAEGGETSTPGAEGGETSTPGAEGGETSMPGAYPENKVIESVEKSEAREIEPNTWGPQDDVMVASEPIKTETVVENVKKEDTLVLYKNTAKPSMVEISVPKPGVHPYHREMIAPPVREMVVAQPKRESVAKPQKSVTILREDENAGKRRKLDIDEIEVLELSNDHYIRATPKQRQRLDRYMEILTNNQDSSSIKVRNAKIAYMKLSEDIRNRIGIKKSKRTRGAE